MSRLAGPFTRRSRRRPRPATAAVQRAYGWMGMNSDISKRTRMDRALDDRHNCTESPPDHVDDFDSF